MPLDKKLMAVVILVALLASAMSVSVFSQAQSTPPIANSPQIQNSAPQSIPFSFTSTSTPLYPVTFSETGLPSGTTWGVNMSGTFTTSVNSTMEAYATAGVHYYSVFNSPDYYAGNSVGSIDVTGTGTLVKVNFTGILSSTSYINLYSKKVVNSTSQLSTTQSVFPDFGIYDSYTQSILAAGFSDSLIYSVSAGNLSRISTFAGPSSPDAIAVNPNNGNIYVVNSTSVYLYNSTGVQIASTNLNGYLIAVTYLPYNNQIVVGNLYGSIEFLNATTLQQVHSITGISVFNSQSFAFNSALNLLEVINNSAGNGEIAFVGSSDTVQYNLQAVGTIISLVYDPSSNTTFYTSYNGTASNAYVLGAFGNILVPGTSQTFGLGFDPWLNAVFATDTQDALVQVINATSHVVQYTIHENGLPLMAFNIPGTPAMIGVNPANDALDVLSFSNTTREVSFIAVGLPSGTSWNVSLNGFSISSTTNRADFYELPGSYSYSVKTVRGYAAVPGGTVSVSTAPVSVYLNFNKTYLVSFNEIGLPSGTNWNIQLSGNVISSSTSSVATSLVNGTYQFTVGSVTGYHSTPDSGYFSVNGSSTAIAIAFSPFSYNLTFLSTGLPAGTSWSVNINGVVQHTTGTDLVYSAVPGTYDYSVLPLSSYYLVSSSGTVKITGSDVQVNLTWKPYLYEVNFTETSLPAGTSWSVNLSDGTVLHSNGSYASAMLPDGQYTFTYHSENLSWEGSSGTFTVSGKQATISLKFTLVTYNITFLETGLPQGTEWQLSTANAGSISTSSNQTTIQLWNGSYQFVATPSNSSYGIYSGVFRVDGHDQIVSVVFSLLVYNVSFAENGLPIGIPWGVYVSGNGIINSTSDAINLSLPDGTYSYTPVNVPGYNVSSGGYFTISSHNLTVTVNYTALPSPPALYSINFYELGLPRDMDWAVGLNGSLSVSPPDGSFNFSLPNGTYSIEIGAVSHDGKILRGSANLTLLVNGSNQTIFVVFYGSYVWIIVDFCTSHYHWHDHNHEKKDDGNHNNSDNVIAETRYRL